MLLNEAETMTKATLWYWTIDEWLDKPFSAKVVFMTVKKKRRPLQPPTWNVMFPWSVWVCYVQSKEYTIALVNNKLLQWFVRQFKAIIYCTLCNNKPGIELSSIWSWSSSTEVKFWTNAQPDLQAVFTGFTVGVIKYTTKTAIRTQAAICKLQILCNNKRNSQNRVCMFPGCVYQFFQIQINIQNIINK